VSDFPGWGFPWLGSVFQVSFYAQTLLVGDRKGIQSLTLKSYLPEQLGGGKKTEKNSPGTLGKWKIKTETVVNLYLVNISHTYET